MLFVILTFRPVTKTIGQNELQSIEIRALHVHALISHNSGQVLPHALTHDSRLAMVRAKTLLQSNRRGALRNAAHANQCARFAASIMESTACGLLTL